MYLYISKPLKYAILTLFTVTPSHLASAESSFEAAKQGGFFYYKETPSGKSTSPKHTENKQKQYSRSNGVPDISSQQPPSLLKTAPRDIKVLPQKQAKQTYGNTRTAVKEANDVLKVGDFVLRRNNSIESSIIREIDGTPYSHIAIVTQTAPEVYVIHAASDDVPSAKYQVIKQRLSDYLSPKLATHFSAYRPTFLTWSDKKLIANYMEKQVGKPFILNSREKTHRYCSSLIYDAVRTRTNQYNPIWKNIKYKHYQGQFLTPSSMITNGQFKKIIDSRSSF